MSDLFSGHTGKMSRKKHRHKFRLILLLLGFDAAGWNSPSVYCPFNAKENSRSQEKSCSFSPQGMARVSRTWWRLHLSRWQLARKLEKSGRWTLSCSARRKSLVSWKREGNWESSCHTQSRKSKKTGACMVGLEQRKSSWFEITNGEAEKPGGVSAPFTSSLSLSRW